MPGGVTSMMPCKIVGSYYRPPASAIVSTIPVGTPLELRAEPNNHVDPNAIAVWIRTKDILPDIYKRLVLAGSSCGFRIDDEPSDNAEAFLASILAVPSWHLGYIPAIVAKTAAAKALLRSGPVAGQFIILDGKPAMAP